MIIKKSKKVKNKGAIAGKKLRKKLQKSKKKKWGKKEWKDTPKNKQCSRAKECKVINCPHYKLHRKGYSCKVKICSALKATDKNCTCRVIK